MAGDDKQVSHSQAESAEMHVSPGSSMTRKSSLTPGEAALPKKRWEKWRGDTEL